MAAEKSRWIKGLFIIWLLLVAGLPVYYLRPGVDWHYVGWGTPEKILESYRCVDDELVEKEGRYTRIFIVQPTEETLQHLGYQENPSYNTTPDARLMEHLQENALPGPYHAWRWPHATGVQFVLCGSGELLVRDPNRNKGGLFSSRMTEGLTKLPRHVVFCYYWAMLGVVTLVLTPFLFLGGGLVYRLCRACRS